MTWNVLVLLDAPQHPDRTIDSRFNKLIRMRHLEMEWGGSMDHSINSLYNFIESPFLHAQLLNV